MTQLGVLTSPTSTSGFSFVGPRPLTEICLKIAIKNLDLLEGVGDLPIEYTVKMLRHIKTPEQLHAVEMDSPTDDIFDITEEHWIRFINKHFPRLAKEFNFTPKGKRNWHRVYEKYKKISDQQIKDATSALAEKMAASRDHRASRQPKILSVPESRRLPIPKERPSTGKTPHWSTLPREKKTFLSKTKKQLAAQQARFKINSPARQPVFGQVMSAPESMVRDARIERQYDPTSTLTSGTTVFSSRKQSMQDNSEAERQRREREARLLSLKGKHTAHTGNVLTFSDDEDEEDEDDQGGEDPNDLFGEEDETDNSALGSGALSIDDLENTDFSSPSATSRANSSSQQRSARSRGGFLSASPGANLKTLIIACSPPKPHSTSASPPLSGVSASVRSVSVQQPPAPLLRKRKPADIFMRPTKRTKH